MPFFRSSLFLLALLAAPAAFPQSSAEALFKKFWAAKSAKEAAALIDDIVKSGVTFDDALSRLKRGREYTAQPGGVSRMTNRTDSGLEHHYAVNIPANYNPARRYQVRFQLHGGVENRTDNQPRGNGEIGALAGAEQIYVLPYAWQDSPWWSNDQIQSLNLIVDSLKRTYNVDENRVVLSGVSDGATGAYYIAMRDMTPFASFLPLNGFILVLANDRLDDGQIFPNNLRNKPFFVINGGRDQLYPTGIVEPYTRHLMETGVRVDYHPQPEGEHNTRWWPEVKDIFEKFVAANPRNPDPNQLTWETADVSRNNRAHWLVINELGAAKGEAEKLSDVNAFQHVWSPGKIFNKSPNAGRVDLVRIGNVVQAVTRGVTEFTLLLSPEHFNFDEPIKVVVNGRELHNARVARNVQNLLTWAARDNDRTMLYGATLTLKLPH